ncbi:serine hydrolase domain-containing protein [Fontibacillus sp. BL9]|uniref:serine hydrolase domain-containing protein n=1 Tax=Fontibacillus sp. BL9 TaxID=3389971 RepID=UPI00397B06C5
MNRTMSIHHGRLDATPEQVGYRREALNRLNALFEELIHHKKIQGASYLLARGGKTFAHSSMGALRHTEPSGDFMPDSIRVIASITKWFTMAAVLRLLEEGHLYLTQPVKDWFPEFDHPVYERINVFHLLTHTSGLAPDPGYFLEPYPVGWWDMEFAFAPYDEEGKTPELSPDEEIKARKSQWIKAMLAGPPVCPPGEQWNYCSNGFALLGEIISVITGQSYESYVQDIILQPLGMNRTFFAVPESMHSEVCITNDWELKRLTREKEPAWAAPRSGGGLSSTLEDLNKFGQMLLNKGTYNGARILSRKTVEMLSRVQVPGGLPAFNWGEDIKNSEFGLSSSLGRMSDPFKPNTIYHEGAGRCALMVDPDEELVVAFFVPSTVGWVPESMINVKNVIWSGLK